MQDNKHRKKLYGYLQGKGIYDSEDQFNADMDSEEGRHALFLRMQQGGYKSSWDDFNNNLKPELDRRADKETKDAEAIAAAGAGTGVDKTDATGGAGVSRNAVKGQTQQAGMRSQQVGTARNQGGTEAGVQRQGNNNGNQAAGTRQGGADLGTETQGTETQGQGAKDGAGAGVIENHNEGAPLMAPSPVDSSKLVDVRDRPMDLGQGPIDPERNIEEEKLINSFFGETMVPRIDEFIKYGKKRSDKANKGYADKIDYSRGLMGNQYASYGDAGKEINVLANDAWLTDQQKVEDNVMKIFGLMPVDGPVRDGKLHKNGKTYRVVNGFVMDTPEQKALGDLVTKLCGFNGKELVTDEKVKPLTEEEIEAMNTLYAAKMNKVVNMLQNNMYRYLQEKGMPANALEYIAKSAWKGSLFGQVTSILVDRAMQDKGFRLKVREDLNGATLKDMIEAGSTEQFMSQYDAIAQLGMEGAAGAGSMIIDSPVFGVSSAGAEGVGMYIGNMVGRRLGVGAGQTAARMVMSAMPFGGYEAIAEGVSQARTGNFDAGEILKAYGSGSLKGAGLGLTSKFIEGAGEKAYKWAFDRFGQNAGQVARTTTKIGGFVGEVGTFTAYEVVPTMWDENGNWKGTSMEEVGNALGRQSVMIGLLKLWGAPSKIIDRIGSADNLRKAFGQEGIDEIQGAGIDLMKMLAGEKLNQEQIDNPNYEGKDPNKVLQNKNNQDRAELVRQVMMNPNISWNTKAATMYIMTGMKLEPGKVARVEVSKDGKVALLKDANGNLIRRRYLNKENRNKVLHGAIHQMHMENIDELESAIGSKIANIPGAIQAVADEEHMSYERIEEAMAASVQGKAEKWQEKIAQKVQKKAEENVANDNIYELAKIRAEIEAEYGVDLNGSIYNLNPSEAQMRATQAYSERLDALAGDITGKNEKIKARMEAKRQAQSEVEAEADRLRPNVRQDGSVVSCNVRGREGNYYRLDDDPAQPEFARVRQDGGQVEYVNKELVTDEKVTDYERYMAGYADAKTGAVDRQMDNQERGLHPNTPGQFRQGMYITITGADGKTKKVVVMAAEGDKVVIQDAETLGKEGAEQTEMSAKDLQQMDSDYKYAYDEANRKTQMTGKQYTAEDMIREKSQQEQKLEQDRQKWGQEVVDYGQKMGTKVTALHSAEEARAAIEEAVASGAISKQKGDELLYKLLDRGEMHGVISEEEYNKMMNTYVEAYNKRMIDKDTFNKLVNDLNVRRTKHYWMINKGSKGWFLTKTGEVFVYLPNATTAADAKSTILHEVVAHKGMRNLLAESGDEGTFNDAMMELANMLPEKDRQAVARLARSKYNNRIAVAMDEYIAKIAESGVEPGWIGRAYGYMRDVVRQHWGLELNNDDIRYMLWRAAEGLKGNEEGRVKSEEGGVKSEEAVDPNVAPQEEGPQPEEQGTPVESVDDVNTIVVGGGEPLTDEQIDELNNQLNPTPVEVLSVDGEEAGVKRQEDNNGNQEQAAEGAGAPAETESTNDGAGAGQAGADAPGTEAAGEAAGPQEGDQFKQATREDLTDNTQLRVIKADGSASIIMIKEIGENGVAQVDIYADGDMTKEPVRTTMHVNELGRMVDSQQVIAHHNESAGATGEGQAAEGDGSPAETGGANDGAAADQGADAPGTEAAGTGQGGADLGTEAGGAVSEAVKKIPVDKEGKLLYEQAPIEDTYQAIYEQYGGDFHQVIQDAVEMAQAAYEKAKKGGDIDAAAQAYRKLKYWQGVDNHHRIRTEAHYKETLKQNVAKNVDGVVNEMLEAGNNYDEIEKRIEDAIEGMRGNEDMYAATRKYWNDISDKVRDEANAQYWSNKLAEGDDVKESLDAMTKEEGEKMLMDLGADQMMWLKSSGSWSGFKQSNVYKRACERNDADLKSIMEEVAEENYQKYLEWKEMEERKKKSGGMREREGEYEIGADLGGDDEYMQAVFSEDMEKAQRMLADKADRMLNLTLLPDDKDEKGFKYHRGPAPTKTRTMYAVLNVSEDGMRAAYAGNQNATPVGVWLDAQNLKSYVSKSVFFDDGTPATYVAGDTGKSRKEGGVEGDADSRGKSFLLERGGKHGSDVPNFSQMNLQKNEAGEKISQGQKSTEGVLPANKLVFEIECGMDDEGDLTEYVKENGRRMKGKNQGLRTIDPNKFYFFKTNPNAVGNWGIAGTFRIKRLVPHDEIVSATEAYKKAEIEAAKKAYEDGDISKKDMDKRVKNAEGIVVQKWLGGYHPENYGVSVESIDKMYQDGLNAKLRDAVTYDDKGNPIPLSQRFTEKQDARYRDGEQEAGADLGSEEGVDPNVAPQKKDEKDEIKGVGTPGREKSNEELADEMVRDIYGDPSTWTGYMKAIREKDVAEKKEDLLEKFAEEDAIFEARKEAVTSDAFRKWFGDWMEDPKNASKVVDMKGRPLMLWHGTSKDKYGFTTFDTNLRLSDEDSGGLTNIGSHFGNKQQAKDVNGGQDKFYQVYLNIRNPYSTWDWFAGLDHELVSAALELAHEIGTPEAMEELKNMEKAWPWIKDFYDADLYDDEVTEAIEEAADGPYVKGGDKVFCGVMRNLLKMGGYDGIRYDNFYDGGGESWVALESNQIKSAEVDGPMKNNGEYSESGDIRMRWIGEQGAGSLDNWNGNTDLMDALDIARDMERRKEGAKRIKYTTGWERGADGKWRYEQGGIHLDEGYWQSVYTGRNLVPKDCTIGDLVNDPTLFQEYPEIRDWTFRGYLTQKEKDDKVGGVFRSNEGEIAVDMSDYEPAVEAWKELKANLKMARDMAAMDDEALLKIFNKDIKYIGAVRAAVRKAIEELNEKIEAQESVIAAEVFYLESTLNHEIQHYIQYVEGFARGGNTWAIRGRMETAKANIETMESGRKKFVNQHLQATEFAKKMRQLKWMLETPKDELKRSIFGEGAEVDDKMFEETYNMFVKDLYFDVMDQIDNIAKEMQMDPEDYGMDRLKYQDMVDQWYDEGLTPFDIAKKGMYIDEVINYLEGIKSVTGNLVNMTEDRSGELARVTELLEQSDEDLYRAIAGEVEARNAEKRMNWDAEKRRSTLASETEDVARTKQIVFDGNFTAPGAEYTLRDSDRILNNAKKENEKTGNVKEDDMEDAMRGITEMRDIMLPYADILPVDQPGPNVFKNQSYGKSVENTTICPRTLAYNAFVAEVQKKIGRPMTQRESFLVSQKLYDIAVDPQCLYCYVSLDRKAYNDMLLRWVQERDAAIAKYKEAGMPANYQALYDEFLHGRTNTPNMKARYKMYTELAKGDPADLLTLEELATDDRIAEARAGKKRRQVLDCEAYARSVSQAKKQVDYRAYNGDILRLGPKWVKDLNSEYGLRFYSFSDYSGAFIVENMQQILDASVKGFKGLAYTKDNNFVRVFAPTGININISVFAKSDGKGGHYIDERQSAKLQDAIELREKYPNVGIVVVATDDEGVKWACRQKWSDVVIPFHIVRTGSDIGDFYKWHKYNSEQNDLYKNEVEVTEKGKKITKRPGSKAPLITPVEHENSFEKYMELCRERGLVPRFERLLLEGDLTNEEYFKMVKEARRSAQETPIMSPKYDYEAAKVAFQEFVDKGGYYGGWYKPGVDFNAETSEVAGDVMAGKTAADVSYGRQDKLYLTEEDIKELAKEIRKRGRQHQEDVERAKRIEQEIFEAKVAGKKVGEQADPNVAPKQAAEGAGAPAETRNGKGGADLGSETGDVRERDGEEEMGAGGADLGSEDGGAEAGGAEEQAGEWGLDRFGRLRWKENVVINPSTEMVDYRKNRKKKSRSMGARAQELMDEGAFNWEDHVEMVLAGGMKFRGDDKRDEAGGVVAKGILSHTGLKRKDIGAWVASKNDENAMTPEVVAEKIYEEMPEGLKEGIDVQDVFNHILEVVTGYERQRILLDAVEKRHLAAEVEGLEEFENRQKELYAQQHGYATWRDFEEAEGWMELQEKIRKEREERMSKILRDKYLRRLGYDGEADYMRQMRNLDKRARKAAMKRRIQELREEILAALDDAERVTNRPLMPERKKGESVFDYAERVSQAQKAQADWDREHMVESMTTQEAQKRIVNLIKDQLDRDSVSAMDKRTLNSILNTLQQTDVNNLPERIEEAKKLVNRIKVRANENDIKRFLDLKVSDTNGKNMSIAKNVDDDTRKIMEMVKGTIADTQDSGLADRIHDLRSENWHAREEIRTMDLEDPDYDAKVDELRKKIDENNTEITSLIQQRSIIINEKVKKGDVSVDAEIARVEKRMEEAAEAGKEYDQNDVNEMTALQVQKFMLDNAQIDRDIIELENKHAVVKVAKRRLYDHYRDQLSAAKAAVDAEPSHDNVEAWKQLSQEYRKQMSRLESMEDGLNRLINEGQVHKAENQERLRDMLSDIVTGGKDSLKTKIENMQKRRLDILRGTIEDIRPDDRNDNAKIGDKENEARAGEHWSKALFTRAISSFEYMAQTIAENSLGKDSYFYKRFVIGQEGVQAAINEYTDSMRRSRERLDEKVKEVYRGKIKTFGDWWKEMDKKPKYGAWGKKHGIRIDKAWATTGITILDMDKLDEHGNPTGERYEITDMSKGQATYMYMLWKMADGRAKLEMMGFDAESMEEVADYIGEKNMRMADWFQDELFAEERERVNDRYKEIYNTSMAAIENYVPIKINGGAIREDVDLSGDSGQGAGKLVVRTGALVNRTINDKPIDTNWSAAKVVWDHLEQVEDFYAFAPVRRDLGWVLSNQYVRNQLNKNSAGAYKRLLAAAEVAVRAKVNQGDRTMDKIFSTIQKGLVGGNIAFRNTTAMKQMLSVPAFFGYSQDPRYTAALMWNIAKIYGSNSPMLVANMASFGTLGQRIFENTAKTKEATRLALTDDVKWVMNNLPDFWDRVTKGTAGDNMLDAEGLSNWFGRFQDGYMKLGMRTNQMVDALTCAIGVKTIYDYKMARAKDRVTEEVKRMIKEGSDEDAVKEWKKQQLEDAHKQALMEATIYYNGTQQSNNTMFLAPQQVSKGFVDRAVSLYQNASIGYARKFVTSVQDLYRLRHWDGQLSKYLERELKDMGYTKEEPAPEKVRKEAEAIVRKRLWNEARKNAFDAILYGYIMNKLWDLGGEGFLGMFTDDPGILDVIFGDAKVKDLFLSNKDMTDMTDKSTGERIWSEIQEFSTMPARGATGMNLISGILSGTRPEIGLSAAEIQKFFDNATRAVEEDGVLSPELMYVVLERSARFAGISMDMVTNTYMGAERMAQDLPRFAAQVVGVDANGQEVKRQDLLIDLMLLMSSPESNRAQVAKKVYMEKWAEIYGGDKHDHMEEIAERWMDDVTAALKYTQEDDVFESWLPSTKVLRDAQRDKLEKEFMWRMMTPAEKEIKKKWDKWEKELNACEDLDSCMKMYKGERDEYKKEKIRTKMQSLAKEDDSDTMQQKLNNFLGKGESKKQEYEKMYIQYSNEQDALEDTRLQQKLRDAKKVYDKWDKMDKAEDPGADKFYSDNREAIEYYQDLYDAVRDVRDEKMRLEDGDDPQEVMGAVRRARREALRM